MFQNYLKTAWRNVMRNKIFSLINISGLALGMTCCLFIFLWVQDEKKVDAFHQNGDRLFTIYQTITSNGQTNGNYNSPIRFIDGNNVPSYLLEGLKDQIPEIQNETSYATGYELPWGHPETFRSGDKLFKLEGSRAGADFFKLFSYPLIAGSATTALDDISKIAISRRMASLFYGSPEQAIGKTIRYENKLNFIVGAVFEDLPKQSTLHFDFLLTWEVHKKSLELASGNFQNFLLLKENADPKKVTEKINRFIKTRLDNQPGVKIQFGLQRYGDRYLYGNFVNGQPVTGRIQYVRIFSGVAIFILLIACINFMNLATARSVRRAKEVGLRKVVGSSRRQLVAQFFGESLVFALIAMILSMVLLMVLLPAFNYFTNKQISLPVSNAGFWISLLGIILATGLIAGSYPAVYLSSLQPVKVLKGVLRFTTGSIIFRKGLTVFQFALSIILLIATIVITRQTDYVQNTNLGYDRENLLYIRIEGALSKMDKYLLFKQRALNLPGIAMIDRSSETPQSMQFVAAPDAISWEGKSKNDAIGFNPASVGFDFVKLMNLQLAAGRDFSPLHPTDSSDAFLVNEEAVRQMNMKDPIGKSISAWQKKGHIIGVLKDYHTHSLREPILPIVLDIKEYEYFGVIIVKTKPGETRQAMVSLEKMYREMNPEYAFAVQFVDEEYKNLYASELIISKLSVLFAALAISISCLGLLGLVIFASEQRIKEIGIRKVLGASVGQIITIFSKDFLRLILIAFLVATPIAWYFAHAWLGNFTYRITISWWIFAMAGMACLLTALITVSYQAIRAALANPVKSLRTE